MELCIENFTPGGNNLMYRKGWEDYQHKNCESKTSARMQNKLHYKRIIDGLTDNRSIDVLNDASLKNVKKMDTREYIIQYIQESNGKKNIQQIAEGVAIALNIPPTDTGAFRNIYDMVVEEMKMIFDFTNSMILAPRHIDIAVDGRDVGIQATEDGVVADANTFSLDGIPSARRDEETGELAVVHWDGDNQAPTRAFNTGGFSGAGLGDSGDIMTEVPGQFSLPTTLPPRMRPIMFNRSGLPDTTTLPFQVDANLMVDDSTAPRAVQGPLEHNGLKELFKPRTTYIRTHSSELPDDQLIPLPERDVQEISSRSTRIGVAQTEETGFYPYAHVADNMEPFSPGRRYPTDPIRNRMIIGGKPQGNKSPMERMYNDIAGMTTRETNTLISGEKTIYDYGKGRPVSIPGIDAKKPGSGPRIIS